MRNKIFLFTGVFLLVCSVTYAFDKTLTVPAESSQGIIVDLPAGRYVAEIAGGAVSLFLPIHPEHQWLYGLAIGRDGEGGQDEPDIGTLYFTPQEKVFTQAEAENEALTAKAKKQEGTALSFTLNESRQVRLWVSDFDYSDNSGSERVKIYSLK